MPKTRVRELAHERGLVTADKPDSQDICFVPTGRYSDMVAKLLPESMVAGEIVDEAGHVLGRHDGIVNFTVGQRKGLMGGASTPLYVLRIDAANARVVVGPREALATSRLTLRAVNWLGDGALDDLPAGGLDLYVRTRSTRPPVAATLHGDGSVTFPAAERAVSPGQACVFYASDADGARVLGGGTVTNLASGTSARSALPTMVGV